MMTPEIQATAERVLRFVFIGAIVLALVACSTPSFINRKPKPEVAPAATAGNFQVTPRELLTARLVNPPANENTPRITVGKLIEFADRYLSCDCSGTRFVRSWQRLPGGYRLTTNSDLVRPLDLACRSEGETMNCYLSEIDRGPQVYDLQDRFVPGSEFIQYMYENGLQCDREGPCPAADPPA